jgi:hypothetical protein
MDDDPNQPFFTMLTLVVAAFVMAFGAVALYLFIYFIEYVLILMAVAAACIVSQYRKHKYR